MIILILGLIVSVFIGVIFIILFVERREYKDADPDFREKTGWEGE